MKDEHNVDGADAVAVVAKATSKSSSNTIDGTEVLIIKQFRPPVGRHVLELPAGLIDAGETPGQAAIRELKEECGYIGTVSSVSPLVYNDPGITNANMLLAVVEVDRSSPDNQSAKPNLHEGEFIESFWAPYGSDLLAWLLRKKKDDGVEIDARLLMWAIGYHQACTDIDTGEGEGRRERHDMRMLPAGAAAGAAPAEKAMSDDLNRDGDSDSNDDHNNVIERRMSSRTNVLHVQTQRKIGPRELVAWGVAAVMTLASIMR